MCAFLRGSREELNRSGQSSQARCEAQGLGKSIDFLWATLGWPISSSSLEGGKYATWLHFECSLTGAIQCLANECMGERSRYRTLSEMWSGHRWASDRCIHDTTLSSSGDRVDTVLINPWTERCLWRKRLTSQPHYSFELQALELSTELLLFITKVVKSHAAWTNSISSTC